MPNVFIHRPGTHNSATIIDPDTGLDKEVVEWSFNATVDGRVGIVSAYFPPGTSEDGAAKRLRQQLIDDPKSLEGITSTGGGGEGSNGEGGSGTGSSSSGGGGSSEGGGSQDSGDGESGGGGLSSGGQGSNGEGGGESGSGEGGGGGGEGGTEGGGSGGRWRR